MIYSMMQELVYKLQVFWQYLQIAQLLNDDVPALLWYIAEELGSTFPGSTFPEVPSPVVLVLLSKALELGLTKAPGKDASLCNGAGKGTWVVKTITTFVSCIGQYWTVLIRTSLAVFDWARRSSNCLKGCSYLSIYIRLPEQ